MITFLTLEAQTMCMCCWTYKACIASSNTDNKYKQKKQNTHTNPIFKHYTSWFKVKK